ncbi:hypothetical protein ACJX0J_007608 [Zea mays]
MRSPIQVNCLGSKVNKKRSGDLQRSRIMNIALIIFDLHIYMNNINGVVVKGDESSGNIDWYGVIKKIIAIDFPQGKEYGIIDIDKTRFSDEKALDEFIEETQTRTIVGKWLKALEMKEEQLAARKRNGNKKPLHIEIGTIIFSHKKLVNATNIVLLIETKTKKT